MYIQAPRPHLYTYRAGSGIMEFFFAYGTLCSLQEAKEVMRQLTEVVVYLHDNGTHSMHQMYMCISPVHIVYMHALYINLFMYFLSRSSTDIVHRDLKLENVLLKSPVDSTSNKMVIKVNVNINTM